MVEQKHSERTGRLMASGRGVGRQRRVHAAPAPVVAVVAVVTVVFALVAACSAMAVVGAPVAQAAPAAAPAAATPRSLEPIVFVHGMHDTGGAFAPMRAKFQAAGVPQNRMFSFEYDSTRSNRLTATVFSRFVSWVVQQTGAARIDVVTHSMGALGTRWCIRFGTCGGLIDDWVSLGGPNHGTILALGCVFAFPGETGCPDMAPGSPFLNQLNSGDETPGTVSYTTIRSDTDENIIPSSSTELTGAHNVMVRGLTHNDLLGNQRVFNMVKTAVLLD